MFNSLGFPTAYLWIQYFHAHYKPCHKEGFQSQKATFQGHGF